MTFKELRQQSGMNLTQFSKYFNIPYRTVQNWELGLRECPEYLLELMKYKLKNELIFPVKDYVKIPQAEIENIANSCTPTEQAEKIKELLHGK